jgi:hypothetical protein
MEAYGPEKNSSVDTKSTISLFLDFLASRTVRNKFSVVFGILQPRWSKVLWVSLGKSGRKYLFLAVYWGHYSRALDLPITPGLLSGCINQINSRN